MEPQFYLDENLRFKPKDPDELLRFVGELKKKIEFECDLINKTSLMGQLGHYLKCLGELDEAQDILQNVIKTIEIENLGIRRLVQNQIRLGHVIQFKEDFCRSNKIFSSIIDRCEKDEELSCYLSFAYQHAGKNFFDQSRYEEALELFKKALELRIEDKAPEDQLESTKKAIERTEHLIKHS